MNDNILVGYIHDAAYQLDLSDFLYFKAVGNQVFVYTSGKVYSVKKRLYEYFNTLFVLLIFAGVSLIDN